MCPWEERQSSFSCSGKLCSEKFLYASCPWDDSYREILEVLSQLQPFFEELKCATWSLLKSTLFFLTLEYD